MSTILGRILIAGSNPELGKLYEAVLSSDGFETRHCTDGQSLLNEADRYDPQVIIIDTSMSQLGGWELLELLRQTKRTSQAKLIALATLIQPCDRLQARELGAELIIHSPGNLDRIRSCIHQHFNNDMIAYA